jgi:hypothetical protein
MFAAIGRFLRLLFGYRSIEIVEESPNRLAVRYGRSVTVIDK